MGEITINTSLTIQGIVGDQKVTIDPLGRSRAFTITPQANVVFENLKFINGIEGKGGAILNLGILELLRCEVSNCHAPVFGAAIYNDISGHLKITNSLVSENVSPYDPSIIFSKGFLEATNSTFSENNGAPTIHAVNGETILNQVTIAKNMQGVVADSGSIKINFSTIAQNSDGGLSLINDSMLTLNSSVFFQNQDDLEASILSESLGDQRSIQGSNLGLSELGNYGGDTPTMPPLPTSLVINMAGPRLFTKDQRGLSREATGLDDLGSTEFQEIVNPPNETYQLDTDSDGWSDALEIAIGRDPNTAEGQTDHDLQILENNFIKFGFNQDMENSFILKVTTSTDLVNFDTTLLSNEYTPFEQAEISTTSGELDISEAFGTSGRSITFELPASQITQRKFYRLEASPRE